MTSSAQEVAQGRHAAKRSWPSSWWAALSRAGKAAVGALALAILGSLGALLVTWIQTWDDGLNVEILRNTDAFSVAGKAAAPGYIVAAAPQDIPEPPGGLNICGGRFAWSRPLDPVDADFSVIRLTLTAEGHPVTVAGAKVEVKKPRLNPRPGTLLACPGRGEVIDVRHLQIDLDTEAVTFLSHHDAEPDLRWGLNVAPGEPAEILDAIATTESCDCAWRLLLTVQHEGGGTETVTVPADGWFETSSSLNASSYQFLDGQWRLVAGPSGTSPATEPPGISSPPAPPDACQSFTDADAADLLGITAAEMTAGQALGGPAPSRSGQVNVSLCIRSALDGSPLSAAQVTRTAAGEGQAEFQVHVSNGIEDVGTPVSSELAAVTDQAILTADGVLARTGDLIAWTYLVQDRSLSGEQIAVLEREARELLSTDQDAS